MSAVAIKSSVIEYEPTSLKTPKKMKSYLSLFAFVSIVNCKAQTFGGDTIFYEGFKTLAWPQNWLRLNLDGSLPCPPIFMNGQMWIIAKRYLDTSNRVLTNAFNGPDCGGTEL